MATPSKIKIYDFESMQRSLSSSGQGYTKRLSDIRAQLKAEIEAVRIFAQPVYEVWINEKAVEDSSQQAWDHCMEQARDATFL